MTDSLTSNDRPTYLQDPLCVRCGRRSYEHTGLQCFCPTDALPSQNERLRAALASAVLMVDKLKVFGNDNVQKYDVEPWRRKVLEEFPNLPNCWHVWERSGHETPTDEPTRADYERILSETRRYMYRYKRALEDIIEADPHCPEDPDVDCVKANQMAQWARVALTGSSVETSAPQCNGLCQGHSSEASISGFQPDANCPVHGVRATLGLKASEE